MRSMHLARLAALAAAVAVIGVGCGGSSSSDKGGNEKTGSTHAKTTETK